jgi:hypothetical protein
LTGSIPDVKPNTEILGIYGISGGNVKNHPSLPACLRMLRVLRQAYVLILSQQFIKFLPQDVEIPMEKN